MVGPKVLLEGDEDLLFWLGPAVQSDLVSLEAEPLEETGLGGGSGYEGGDEIPAFLDVVYL